MFEMIRILFLIHDLGRGGAEKVLVNLANNMDPEIFDVSVIALLGGGENERLLAPHVHYRCIVPFIFRGNSTAMKMFSPQKLHDLFVREKYDIEAAYLEGPSARIISGCSDPSVKKVVWIHSTMHSEKDIGRGFRSPGEARECYSKFDRAIFVSEGTKTAFYRYAGIEDRGMVLYNTNDTDLILNIKDEDVPEVCFREDEFKMISVGKILKSKGIDRMARIIKRLRDEGRSVHFYAAGTGPDQKEIEEYVRQNGISDYFTIVGYQPNPYKFVSKCDLFVCASLSEGFSTSTTEALITGTPVCTVEVSGMREMLGESCEYGLITENTEEALYQGIRKLMDDRGLLSHYREKAAERGKRFSKKETVAAVEQMFNSL